MSGPYIERSRQVVEGLDPEQISRMSIGDATYENRWFTRHILGKTLLRGETIHLGVDLPKGHTSGQALFMTNLRQISYMLELAADQDLRPYAPSFVAALAADAEVPASAILTDDPTEGGRYTFEPCTIPAELQQKSTHLHFASGGRHAIATVMVDGQPKIASFSPGPFAMSGEKGSQLGQEIDLAQRHLTLVTEPDSALAGDLTRRGHMPG